jgi:hypothetical protein
VISCRWEWLQGLGTDMPFLRFHYMWDFLGLPWKDIEIVDKSKI